MLRVHGSKKKYHHDILGTNSRLDALQAAILRVKLRHLNTWSDGRRNRADRYRAFFETPELARFLITPAEPAESFHHVYNQFTIRVKHNRRDALLASLRSQQIGAAIYYPIPLHLQECFASLGYTPGTLPASEAAAAEVVSLPIFPELGAERQEQVVRGIARALGCLASESSEEKPLRRVA